MSFVTDNNNHTVSRFFGDPLISILSNLMIHSIKGNSPLQNAQVICISDFHYDFTQKYIRAGIVNEIFCSRMLVENEFFFLVEGTEAGYEPDEFIYNRLIGNHLIHFIHFTAGWDNMHLNQEGIHLIKEVQRLLLDRKKIEKECTILEQAIETTDLIKAEINDLFLQAKKVSITIQSTFDRITELAAKRNDSLHRSIRKVLEKHPTSIVFVIGGEYHFKYISKYIEDIRHCILNLKRTRTISDTNDALTEVYGTLYRS